ncbi:dienelactone hydrolase family protein [Altererythrobacter sp. H2]|uniref:dienelactone hydrolase family protein n=1 Tax=Altererythrobacter sp. H2 TaxID=3108391 RepID=UPI002B4BE3C9|nr:dienelactone hydrolase family protein [Altererythrobacter sp. H2]WRK96439.1 dienelactone hydrolase family protein [Altererythrobacter sp. H2]
MCNEEQLTRWAREGLSRRQFGALGVMAVAGAACAPVAGDDSAITLPAMAERDVAFTTASGTMDGWFVHPMTRPAPAVILWPDIAGLRESKKDIARRLAGRGYATLVLNQYYRDTRAPIWTDFADFAGNGGWDRARAMRGKLTAEAIMSDARAAVAWLDAQEEVDTARGIGSQGYCMGGPFAVWTAAAVPDRVRAAASFHGGGLVRAGERLSPHAQMPGTKAGFLIAVARDDHAKAPADTEVLQAFAEKIGRGSTTQVYDGDHGWTVPDSPAYAPAAEAASWDDLMRLYAANL